MDMVYNVSNFINILYMNYILIHYDLYTIHFNTFNIYCPKSGMRGLYIGIHNSCSLTPEPLLYKYIISVTISSFWSKRCTIGNIYFPQTRWREERLIAYDELWESVFRFNYRNSIIWDINDSISIQEIRSAIFSLNNNKAPGPDGITIEFFFKALFCNKKFEKDHPSEARCLEIIFNKFWNIKKVNNYLYSLRNFLLNNSWTEENYFTIIRYK